METEQYFLTKSDLEKLENGENIEIITIDNRLVILSLESDETN